MLSKSAKSTSSPVTRPPSKPCRAASEASEQPSCLEWYYALAQRVKPAGEGLPWSPPRSPNLRKSLPQQAVRRVFDRLGDAYARIVFIAQESASGHEAAPGTHVVKYQSAVDDIEIKHTAHSREGFAVGAVLVAEWIKDKKGILGMNDFLQF